MNLRRLLLASVVFLSGLTLVFGTTDTRYRGMQVQIGQLIHRSDAVVDGSIHNGKELECDLPLRMHLKNKGGSDGAGLCVFASINMAAEWQNVNAGRGLLEWMTKHPGGGYPEKVDRVLQDYCKELGIKVPSYVQHTGGDVAFLKLALESGRMPCVTYGGHDSVYYYMRIAHMVDLVYLDDNIAAILDNNFPGQYLWMSTQMFLDRWREDGGWAFVWLGPTPPPLPANQKEMSRTLDKIVGVPSCPNGIPQPPEATKPVDGYQWVHYKNSEFLDLCKDGKLVGAYLIPDGEYRNYDEVWGEWSPPCDPPIQIPEKYKQDVSKAKTHTSFSAVTAKLSYGVDTDRLRRSKTTYTMNGSPCSWKEIQSSIGADLPKTYLTFTGNDQDRASFQATVSQLPQDLLNILSVQVYSPTNWAVVDVGMPLGTVCQKGPDSRGRGVVLWRSDRVPTTEELKQVFQHSFGFVRQRPKDYDSSKDPTLDDVLRKRPSPVMPDPERPSPLIHPLPDNKDVHVAIPTWVGYVGGGFVLAFLILRANRHA